MSYGRDGLATFRFGDGCEASGACGVHGRRLVGFADTAKDHGRNQVV